MSLESGAISAYYDTGLLFTTSTSDVRSVDEYFHARATDLATVDAKHSAMAYVDSIENLKAAYNTLSTSIADNSRVASDTLLLGYANQLFSDAFTISKAFLPHDGGLHGASQ